MWETVINHRSGDDESTEKDLKEDYNLTKLQLAKTLHYMNDIYARKMEYEVDHYREMLKRKKQEEELVRKTAEKLEKEKKEEA